MFQGSEEFLTSGYHEVMSIVALDERNDRV